MKPSRRASALLILAIGCSDENLTRVRGELDLERTIDFGDVQVGIQKTIILELKNIGNTRVVVSSIDPDASFANDRYEFHVATAGLIVQPSEVASLALGFRPFMAADQPYESSFTIATDDGPINVVVRGRGIESGLIVEPNPVDFGSVLTGSTKRIEVKVTNALSERVRVTTDTSGGQVEVEESTSVNRFAVIADVALDGMIAELEPGASFMLPVEYTPVAADQPDRGRFYLANCDSDLCKVAVVLTGGGSSVALACTPGVLDFGAVHPGVIKTLRTSCQNVAGAEISVIDVGLLASTDSEYSLVAPSLPAAIAPGASLELDVAFSPTQSTYDTGAMPTGAVEIEGLDPMGYALDPVQVALTGRAGGSSIEVLPRILDFGMIALGTSHTKRLLVVNNGYDDLVVSGVDADTAQTGSYSADPSGFLVAPGGAITLEVTFTPQIEGPIASTLVITNNDGTNPMVDVTLFGTGIDLPPCAHRVLPAMLQFGAVALNDTPTLSFAIENIGTNDCLVNDLDFLQPALSSTNAFDLLNGAETGILIAPGATHDVPVMYTPTRTGVDRATVGFYINDPRGSNPEVELVGVGEPLLAIQCPAQVTTAVGTGVTLSVTAQIAGGNITGYLWTIGSAPTGGIGTPNQWTPDPPTSDTETFLPFIVGTYDLLVEVFDDQGQSAFCTTQVIAQGEGLVVTMTWDGSGDVDLHVHNQTPTPWFGSTDDCYYANRTPIWDAAFPASQGSNPELDFDNTFANGPENTRISVVQLNQPYTIGVHNYSAAAGRTATIDIYCGGVTSATYSVSSNPLTGNSGGQCTANDFWRVATVTFTSQSQCTVTPINTYNPSTQACATF